MAAKKRSPAKASGGAREYLEKLNSGPLTFGQLINTALSVRKRLGGLAILVVTPFLYFTLARNGASTPYTAVLIALVLAGGVQ